MKRLISVILTLSMMLSFITVVPVQAASYDENSYTLTGVQVNDIVEIAKTQVGYKEGNNSSQLDGTVSGNGNYTKYAKELKASGYGASNPNAWCAYFVSWCAMKAGCLNSAVSFFTGVKSCVAKSKPYKSNGLGTYHAIKNYTFTLVYYSTGKGKKCKFAINTPKTKKGYRKIPMMDFVKEAFLLEKAHQEETGITCQVTIDCYTDFIFVNRFGSVQHYGTVNKAIRRIVRDYNDEALLKEENPVLIPNFSCHNLRHTFATRLCEADMNLKVIQDVLGHKEVKTTLEIYTHVTEAKKRQEVNALETMFAWT